MKKALNNNNATVLRPGTVYHLQCLGWPEIPGSFAVSGPGCSVEEEWSLPGYRPGLMVREAIELPDEYTLDQEGRIHDTWVVERDRWIAEQLSKQAK